MSDRRVNPVSIEAAKWASVYSKDLVYPQLLSFSLNLNVGEIFFTFDETVNASSFDVNAFRLVSDDAYLPSSVFAFTTDDVHSLKNDVIVTVVLSHSSLNKLKGDRNLAGPSVIEAFANTFVSIQVPGIVSDMAGNFVEEVLSENAIRMNVFTPDSTRPNIIDLQFNRSSGVLNILFDETVDLTSIQLNFASLYSGLCESYFSRALNLYKSILLFNLVDVDASPFFSIQLTTHDLQVLQFHHLMMTSSGDVTGLGSNALLSFSSYFVVDMNLNEISNTSSHGLSFPCTPPFSLIHNIATLSPDVFAPTISNFSLDMNFGVLNVTFSKAINVTAFFSQGFGLGFNSTIFQFEFPQSFSPLPCSQWIETTDCTTISLSLTEINLNKMKFRNIGFNVSSSLLYVQSAAVYDYSGNKLATVNSLLPVSFKEDKTNIQLRGYDFNFETYELTLSFSETANKDFINATAFNFLNKNDVPSQSFALSKFDALSSNDPGAIIVAKLLHTDMNIIKKRFNLASGKPFTFLSVDANGVKDMNNNILDVVSALQVTQYTTQSTHPKLMNFSINLNTNLIQFYFSETVNVSSFILSKVLMVGSDSSTISLQGSSFDHTVDSSITVNFSAIANSIKVNSFLGKSYFDTTVSMQSDTVSNMNGLSLIPNTMMTNDYQADQTSPIFTSFDLFMDDNDDHLVLYFDEAVNVETLVISSLTLVNQDLWSGGGVGMINYTLTDSIQVSGNGTMARIQLSFADRNAIKLLSSLATGPLNTFVNFFANGIRDMALYQNKLYSTRLMVSMYDKDDTFPILTQFKANINDGTITLDFNEPVDTSTFSVTSLIIQPKKNSPSVDMFRLTGGFTASQNGLQVIVNITKADLDNIKKRLDTLLATTLSTFLQVEASFIKDMGGNPIVPILNFSAMQAYLVINNSVIPYVTGFDVDMTSQVLKLYFSETVRLTSLNVKNLILQRKKLSIDGEYYQLTGGYLMSTLPNTVVEIQLQQYDVNFILSAGICMSNTTTWLVFTDALVVDMGPLINAVLPSVNGNALMVSSYFNNRNSPYLTSFDIDFNSGIYALNFNEPVNSTSFNATYVQLFSTNNSESDTSRPQYRLSADILGLSVSLNGTQLSFNIGSNNFNEIKRKRGLCRTTKNCFLSLNSNAILSIFGIPNQQSSILDTLHYTADTVSPEVTSFSLDMTARLIYLTFSETINASSININKISIVSEKLDSSSRVKIDLTPGVNSANFPALYTTASVDDGLVITLTLGRIDFNRITFTEPIGNAMSTSFIVCLPAMITDMSFNAIQLTNSPAVSILSPSIFSIDTLSPKLESFSLDFMQEVLILTFSETVRISTFVAMNIYLQSSLFSSAQSHKLTSSSLYTSINSDILLVNLSLPDLNSIKINRLLCKKNSNCYISFLDSLVQDMAGNRVIEVPTTSAQVVDRYTKDDIPPVLKIVDFNANTSVLTVMFSEVVDLSTLMLNKFIMQNAADNSTIAVYKFFQFSGQGLTPFYQNAFSSDGDILYALVLNTDMNDIKINTFLGTSRNNTFINVKFGGVYDMAGVPIQGTTFALQVRNFVADEVAPYLLYFELNMNTDLLTLSFYESINKSTFDLSKIALNSNGNNVILSGGTPISINNGPLQTIFLSENVTNFLKFKQICAKPGNGSDCYLSFSPLFASDMSSNHIVPAESSPIDTLYLCKSYLPDVTSPVVVSYAVNMLTSTLFVSFNEPVNVSSLIFSFLRAQIAATIFSGASMFSLTGGKNLTQSDDVSRSLSFNLVTDDQNRIKLFSPLLWREQTNAWLYLTNNAIYDMNQNGLAKFDPSQPASLFVPDTGNPSLSRWAINVNTGLVSLTFDEPVQVVSFNSLALSFCHSSTEVCFQLEQITTIITAVNSLTIQLQIQSSDDMVRLKANYNVRTPGVAQLTFSSSLAFDMSANSVSPSNRFNATTFTVDTVAPSLISWNLNLHTGVIFLNFNEPVEIVSFNSSDIILSSIIAGGLIEVRLSNTTSSYQDSSKTKVTVDLSKDDRLRIAVSNLSVTTTSTTNIFIKFSSSLVCDIQGLQVTSETSSNFNAFSVVPDERVPVVVAWNLNMSSDQLSLYFEVPIQPATLFVSALSMQSGESSLSSNAAYSFIRGTTQSLPGYTVIIDMSLDDSNNIKRKVNLSKSSIDSYLFNSADLIVGVNKKYVSSIPSFVALRVANYTTDTIAPTLNAFNISMDGVPQLTLSFSETIQVQKINLDHLKIVGNNISFGQSFKFDMASSVIATDIDNNIIIIRFGASDSNRLKRLTTIATYANNTFVIIDEGLCRDMATVWNSNDANKILPASRVFPDVTAPTLVSFDLNMQLHQITLTLSETADEYSFIAEKFSLASATVGGSATVISKLEDVQISAVVSTLNVVYISLNVNDINVIKSLIYCQSIVDSFLRYNFGAFSDMSGNKVVANSKVAFSYTRDASGPVFLSAVLNLSSEIISFTFDEPIATVDLAVVSSLFLFGNSSYSINLNELTFVDDDIHNNGTSMFSFRMGSSDLNDMKLLLHELVNSDKMTVTLLAGAVKDLAFQSNFNVEIYKIADVIPDKIKPIMSSFAFDLRYGILTINFNEPILASSINTSFFTMRGLTLDVLISLQDCFVALNNGLTFMFNMSVPLLNYVKAVPTVGTSKFDTYLCFDNSFAVDISGNKIIAIGCSVGIKAAQFIENNINPRLTSYSFNLNNGTVEFFFDETVNASSCIFTSIVFQSTLAAQDSERYRLTPVQQLIYPDYSTRVSFNINNDDLNVLKQRYIANSLARTWLSFDSYGLMDMQKNSVIPLVAGVTSKLPSHWYLDETSPYALKFNLSLNTSTLEVYFSETVAGITFTAQHILFCNLDCSVSYNLTASSQPFSSIGPFARIQICDADINAIKQLGNLCTSQSNCFLHMTKDAITDVAIPTANKVVPTSNMQVQFFSEDKIAPRSSQISLNMTSAILLISFDEPVRWQSVNVSGISLLDTNLQSFFRLTSNSTVVSTVNTQFIAIRIGEADLNIIKMYYPSVGGQSTVFKLSEAFIFDMNMNTFLSFTDNSLLSNSVWFVPDITRPRLLAFDLNMTSPGLITLYFSETVNASTLVSSKMALGSSLNGTTIILSAVIIVKSGLSVLEAALTGSDLDNLKIQEICIVSGQCFLDFADAAILDVFGNPLVAAAQRMAVSSFSSNTIAPQLLDAQLNMNTTTLTLVFSEVINSSSTVFSQIGLQNIGDYYAQNVITYNLTVGINKDTQFLLSFTDSLDHQYPADIRLLMWRGRAISESINFTCTLSSFKLNNSILSQNEANSQFKTVFKSLDGTYELILLDLDARTTETVNGSSKVLLVNLPYYFTATNLDVKHQNTREQLYLFDSFIYSVNSKTMVIHLGPHDEDYLKKMQTIVLTRNISFSYVSLFTNAMTDMFGVLATIVSTRKAFQMSSFVADAISPALKLANLNMNKGEFTFIFSEVLNEKTFNPSLITLQAFSYSSMFKYTLLTTNYSINVRTVTIILTLADMNNIKCIPALATSVENTFISFPNTLVQDTSSNLAVEYLTSHSFQITVPYVADVTSPLLKQFAFNLSSNIMSLSFSETINMSSVLITSVRLQSEALSSTVSVQLQQSSEVISICGEVVVLKLDFATINEVQKFHDSLCSNESNCFVVLQVGSLADQSGNYIVAGPAMAATTLTLDTIAPTLDRFSVNLTSQAMIFTFSEVVRINTFSKSLFQLQSNFNIVGGTKYHIISDSAIFIGYDDYIVTIFLDYLTDMNVIKNIVGLYKSLSTSFLAVSTGGFKDMSGNNMVGIFVDAALNASFFSADSINPKLVKFNLNMHNQTITLFFDEPVVADSLKISSITVTNTVGNDVTLNSSRGSFHNGLELTISLSKHDNDAIARQYGFAKSKETSQISILSSSVYDIALNAVTNTKLNASIYIEDNVSPILLSFAINLSNNFMKLSFSEAIDLQTFEVSQLTISGSNGSPNFSLDKNTNLEISAMIDAEGTSIIFSLLPNNLNNIKRLFYNNVATALESSFISASGDLVKDMSGNDLIAINFVSCSNYVSDDVPPTITAFDLNLNTRQLTIHFSETINIANFFLQKLLIKNSNSVVVRLSDSVVIEYNPLWTSVLLNLSTIDFAFMKMLDPVLTFNTTFLSADPSAIQDVAGNSNVVASLPVSTNFFLDTTDPILINFDFDASLQIVYLEFDEPISIESLHVEKISIKNNVDLSYNLMGAANGTILLSSTGRNVSFMVNEVDMNAIKVMDNLADSIATTFIALQFDAIRDTSGNKVQIIDLFPVTIFQVDIIAPKLTEFSVNMSSGSMTLTFNEIVRFSTFDVSKLSLMQKNDPTGIMLPLTTPTRVTNVVNAQTVAILFSQENLDAIKLSMKVATMSNNSFLDLRANAVYDMSSAYSNAGVSNMFSFGMEVSVFSFTADHVRPVLTNFRLDMNSSTIILSFDEPILGSSVNITSFSLSNQIKGFYYVIDFGVSEKECKWDVQYNGRIFIIFMGANLSNQLKKFTIQSSQAVNISLLENSITDMVSNPVSPTQKFPANTFIPDEIAPLITQVSLPTGPDGENQIIFMFSETIQIATVNYDAVTIISGTCPLFGVCPSIVLTGGIPVANSEDSTIFVFDLTASDILRIKHSTILRFDISKAKIAVTQFFIKDMNNNPNVPVAGMTVTFATSPTNPPSLTTWMINVFSQYLVLNFDESVDVSTLNVTKIVLKSTAQVVDPFTYRLTPSSFSNSSNGQSVTIYISKFDLDAFELVDVLLMSNTSAFIDLEQSCIFDLAFTPNPSTMNFSVPASLFIKDTNRPELVRFKINMNLGILYLHYTKIMRSNTFNPLKFAFQSDFTNNVQYPAVPLLGGDWSPFINGKNISLKLLTSDLNIIKQKMIASTQFLSWITFTDDSIQDMEGNLAVPYVSGVNLKSADAFVADTTYPKLMNYTVNMDISEIVLTFDEPVFGSSFKPSSFCLTWYKSALASTTYCLTTSSTVDLLNNALVINISVGSVDINIIKNKPFNGFVMGLADLTFVLSIIGHSNALQAGITDMVGNPLTDVTEIPAASYVKDVTRPTLLAFDIHLSLYIITFRFNEPMAAEIIPQSLCFQNASSNLISYNLTTFDGIVQRSTDGMTLSFQLNRRDLNEIEKITSLYIDRMSSFISISKFAFQDVNGNFVNDIQSSSALQVTSYTPDTVPPELTSFAIDLHARKIVLQFSETVLASSLDVSQFTLYAINTLEKITLRTTSNTVSYSKNGPEIVIFLGKTDYDDLRELTTIVTSVQNSYLAITSLAIKDMYANKVSAVNITAFNFTDDRNPLALVSWAVNLTAETLTLTFSTTVNVSSLNIHSIILQGASVGTANNSFSFIPLDTLLISSNHPIIVLNLGTNDLNLLKQNQNLMTQESNSYLSFAASFVYDMSFNKVVPVNSVSGLKVASYAKDTISPKLLQFSIDMSTGIFTLTFDESVLMPSINLSEIIIAKGITNNAPRVKLTGGTVFSSSSPIQMISLKYEDMNELKRMEICRTADQCYLVFSSIFVTDMQSNLVVPVFNVIATINIPDIIPPKLKSFVVNMNLGVIFLFFSEPIRASAIQANQITVQNFFSPEFSYALTCGSVLDLQPAVNLTFTLCRYDLDEIKASDQILSMRSNSWISFTASAFADMARDANYIQPVDQYTANLADGMPASRFYPDLVSPTLTSFSLDMNSQLLYLNFSEPVRIFPDLTVKVNQLCFVNEETGALFRIVCLTDSFVSTLVNSPSIVINISFVDLEAIKFADYLGKTISNTFIIINSAFVQDMNLNFVIKIGSTPLPATKVVADTIAPILLNFDLNMNSGNIVLSFSETLRKSTLLINKISIHNNDGRIVFLTEKSSLFEFVVDKLVNGTLVTQTMSPLVNGRVITIVLGGEDLDAIKMHGDLATSKSSTFIQLDMNSVLDMNQVKVKEVPEFAIKQVSMYQRDETKPTLLWFELDMTLGQLYLSFDEVVRQSLFDAALISLTNNYPSLHVRFEGRKLNSQSVVIVSTTEKRELFIKLSDVDLNEIKQNRGLAKSKSSVVIIFNSSFISDMALIPNGIESRLEYDPKMCNSFTSDSKQPTLLFFKFDANLGLMSLTFDETVKASTFKFKTITVQKAANSGSENSHSISGESSFLIKTGSVDFWNTTVADTTVFDIQLSSFDRNSIQNKIIGVDHLTTWISFNVILVSDMSGNQIMPHLNGDAFSVFEYVADNRSPLVNTVAINLLQGFLIIKCSKPINAFDFDPTFVAIQDRSNSTGITSSYSTYALTGSQEIHTESIGTVLVVSLNDNDLARLQKESHVPGGVTWAAKSEQTTFVSVHPLSFHDLVVPPNLVKAIPNSNALQVVTLGFEYYKKATFTSLSPVAGKAEGGTIVKLFGTGFIQSDLRAESRFAGTPLPVSVYLNGFLTPYINIISENELEFATPNSNVTGAAVEIELRIDEALSTFVPQAFTFLAPPSFSKIKPSAGTVKGSTVLLIFGENFGPQTASNTAPIISVHFIAVGYPNFTCANTVALSDSEIMCLTPNFGDFGGFITVVITIDNFELPVTSGFEVLQIPELSSIEPTSTYINVTTSVRIMGAGFGPASNLAPSLLVYFGDSECVNPRVIVDDSIIECDATPKAGTSSVKVIIDGISSNTSTNNVEFVVYEHAGVVSFSTTEFQVSENSSTVSIALVRSLPSGVEPSPVTVTVSIADGSATSPHYFIQERRNVTFLRGEYAATVNFIITAAARTQQGQRKGVLDDRFANLGIDSSYPLFGTPAIIGVKFATLNILATCQAVTTQCITIASPQGVYYFRKDQAYETLFSLP